jgi:sugar phosphate isomerase/epimerase
MFCPARFANGYARYRARTTWRTVVPELKIGIHLPSLRVPFERAILLATKLGANAVEIDARQQIKPAELSQTALRQLRKILADYRLRVCAIDFPTRRGYDTLQDLDARVAGTKAAMRMAQALGANVVVNHVGHIPATPDGPQWNLLLQVLTDLGRYGQRIGALLAAQTGQADSADLARLIEALPEGSLGVDLDPGQLVMNDHSATGAAQRLASHIMHVRATDAVRDLSRGRGLEVPLGRGSVDFPNLLGTLEQRGYRGYFTIQRDNSNDPEFNLGQAIQYLRNL